MDFYDFISQEEIDNLPSDSDDAFVKFVGIAKSRLNQELRERNENNPEEYEYIRISKFNFLNCVSEISSYLNINIAGSNRDRSFNEFDESEFKNFNSDIERYVARVAFRKSDRLKRDAVFLSVDAKSKIRSYVAHIRDLIERSDIDEKEKIKLIGKLTYFENELNKNRISLLEIGRIAIEIAVIPGAVAATTDLIAPLFNKITAVIAQERSQPENNVPRIVGGNIYLTQAEPAGEKSTDDIPF